MRRSTAILAALAIFVPSTSLAAGFQGSSRTFIRAYGTSDDRFLTLYEYLDARFEHVGGIDLAVHLGAWGRADVLDPSLDKQSAGDIQYAYVDYRWRYWNADLAAGRLFSNGGPAGERLDGVRFNTGLPWGFRLTAFAGLPADADEDGRGGDSIWGGRLGQGIGPWYQLDLAYLKERNDGDDLREELSLDIVARYAPYAELSGRSVNNLIDNTWQSHDYALSLKAFSWLEVVFSLARVDYGALFNGAVNDAFKPPFLDPDETMIRYGGRLGFRAPQGLALETYYIVRGYDKAGDSGSFGAEASYRAKPWSAGFSVERQNGSLKDMRYTEYRAWGTAIIGRADVSLDMVDAVYDRKIYGVEQSVSASLALGYALGATVKLGADVEYGRNPYYDTELKTMLTARFDFSAATLPEGGDAP